MTEYLEPTTDDDPAELKALEALASFSESVGVTLVRADDEPDDA